MVVAAKHAAEQMAAGGYEGLDELPRRILNSNVLFEAFGNAKTTRNNDSSRRLVFAELGARWGTWSGRAGAFARALGMPYSLLMVEANRVHCDGIRRVLELNDMRSHAQLDCGYADASRLRKWILSHSTSESKRKHHHHLHRSGGAQSPGP